MERPLAIEVHGVGKTFKVPHERYSSLKQNVIHMFTKRRYSIFQALEDVTFDIKQGEFFGIVGRNGSGKSTLLKMLAGIYVPSTGTIKINGPLSPFIELGVGFNPELSARDNVFLNGAILGLTRVQIGEKFEEIIHFAELEELFFGDAGAFGLLYRYSGSS
jgi:ABC-2 type transport system ATP-binding protein